MLDSHKQVRNPEPSVTGLAEDLENSLCHFEKSCVSESTDEAPDKSVFTSEVVDLTLDDSPSVDSSCSVIQDATNRPVSHSEVLRNSSISSSTFRDDKKKVSRKRSFDQKSNDDIQSEFSKAESKKPSVSRVSEVHPTKLAGASSVTEAATSSSSGVQTEPSVDIYTSLPLTCPVVIELLAGSGRVTAHLKHVGVKSAFGVDHKNLSKIAPIKICDLTTPEGQKLCFQWCQSPLLAGVFAAPPCGTCSRARSIILRDSKGRPLPGPVPLRSDSYPNGLPFLRPTDRARVSSANRLYDFLSRLVQKLVLRGVPIVIENPRNSIYWLTSFFQIIKHHFSFTAHQACAYGSKRPKWTALAHTHNRFSRINKCCPGVCDSHVHEEWGFKWNNHHKVFATSEETAYPMQLAAEIALRSKMSCKTIIGFSS